MDILYGLTYRNLKMNKRRTLVTIIGVILATTLISVVAIMTTSLYDSLITREKTANGNYHIRVYDVPKEDLTFLENYREVKDSFTLKEIGTASFDSAILKDSSPYKSFRKYLRIVGIDENFLSHFPVKLVAGKYPTNDSEILITTDLLKAMNEPYQIGDKLILEVGTRVDKDGKRLIPLNLNFEMHYSDNGTSQVLLEEQIVNTEKVEYTIVGVIESLEYKISEMRDSNYYFFTYTNDLADYQDVFLNYRNPYKAKEVTKTLIGNKYNTAFHDPLLDLQTIKLGNEAGSAFGGVAGIIIFVIMISSILVIRNGFSISVVERYKQFGLLSSVGATTKQIRKSVLFEGLLIGAIAIPIGILLGILSTFLLIVLCTTILEELNFLYLSISWLSMLLIIIPTMIIILLSCWVPSLMASRMSAVEAIRSNQSIKMKRKRLKTPKIISKVFGIGGEVSYKNLKRSKKKYQTTVLSLIVSIIMFITLSAFIDLVFYLFIGYYDNSYSYDLVVDTSIEGENMSVEDALLELEKRKELILSIEGLDRYALERRAYLSTEDPKLFVEDYYDYYISYYDRPLEEFYGNIEVSTLGEEEFKKYVESIGGKVEDYQDGAILIDRVSLEYYRKFYEMNLLRVREGESITLFGRIPNSDKKEEFSIKILKRTDKKPLSMPSGIMTDATPRLIVSDSYFEKNFVGTLDMSIYINTSDSKKIIERIEQYNDNTDTFKFYDYQSEKKAQEAIRLLVYIFSYGFIVVITLIGVTNIFNTITTNMMLRKGEFAMLRAIGMTDKEFNRMIRLESFFYGFKSLLIGIIVSIILTYWMHSSLSIWLKKSYAFPIIPILISIIFVFVVVYIIMHYSLRQINKQNIIETIREENI